MSDAANIEAHIASLRKTKERRDLALRLEKVPEFKQLILDEFCEAECARFARSSGDPALSADERAASLAMAQAAGHLKRWLHTIVRMGSAAEDEIVEAEQTLAELRAEGQET